MSKYFIIDDESSTREQIRASINWEKMNIEIVGEAEDGLQALVLCEQLRPDIVICDGGSTDGAVEDNILKKLKVKK